MVREKVQYTFECRFKSDRALNPLLEKDKSMRITPAGKYSGLPCSYVGSGCAYEDIFGEVFDKPLPEGLKSDGWLTLEGNNRYVRSLFDVAKKVYYKRGERPMLRDFL